MSRPSPLAEPDYAKQVAEMYANGDSRETMSNALGVTKMTITRWRKDPRIKALVHALIHERIQRVTSKTDAALEARLQDPDKLTVKELIEIRKEFMGNAMRGKLDEADGTTINAAMQAAEDPEFMAGLAALTAAASKG